MDLEAELVALQRELALLRSRVRTLEARTGSQAVTVGSKTGRQAAIRLSDDGTALELET